MRLEDRKLALERPADDADPIAAPQARRWWQLDQSVGTLAGAQALRSRYREHGLPACSPSMMSFVTPGVRWARCHCSVDGRRSV